MMIRDDVNDYGTPIRVYWCESCGVEFDVCPIPESDDNWKGCLMEDCDSYDPSRDADKMFDDDSVNIVKDRIQ